MLTLHIGGTHIDAARHVHQSANRSCGHAVLTGAGLSHDAFLTHLLGNQDLTDGVVNLVRTRVVQVLALQVELATILLAHALGQIERRGATHIVTQQGAILILKLFALNDRQISLLEVLHRLVENLGDVGSAKLAVEAIFVNLITLHIFLF